MLAAALADGMLSVGIGDTLERVLRTALAEGDSVPEALTLADRDIVSRVVPDGLKLGDRLALVDVVGLKERAAECDGKDFVSTADKEADAESLCTSVDRALVETVPETAAEIVAGAETVAGRVESAEVVAAVENVDASDGLDDIVENEDARDDALSIADFDGELVAIES